MYALRSFDPQDIAPVADLRVRCFRHTSRSGQDLHDHFRHVFFDSPWRDPALPSLVCESRDGRIVGFVGVLPRPLRLKTRRVRAAVFTQFMVDPACRGEGIGKQLVQGYFDGPQDLSITDIANAACRHIWCEVGGSTAVLYSLYWTRLLRPSPVLIANLGRTKTARVLASLGRPVSSALDAVAARLGRGPFHLPPPRLAGEELSVPGLSECLSTLPDQYSLVPEYDPASLEWLLGTLVRGAGGRLVMRCVRGAGGQILGWYLYLPDESGMSEVVHLAAAPAAAEDVIHDLLYDARRRGAASLRGQLLPPLAQALSDQGCSLRRRGPWTLIRTDDREISEAILRGDAFLTRLEGEWWLNF